MRGWLLAIAMFGCAFLMEGCVHRYHDYTFSVTGYVTAEDGSPLTDAEVLLQVDTPVYAGVRALKTERIVTGNGGFVFMYLSGMPSTKYSVTVRKEGFEPQTVSGSAPPDGHHTIRLKRL